MVKNILNKNFAAKEEKCPICEFPILDHMGQVPCYDDNEILGRTVEVVNEYASTCDGCSELTMHEFMTMDMETQLGYCDDCIDEYIENNPNAIMDKEK